MAIKIEVGATYNDRDIKRAQADLQSLSDAAGGASKSFGERFADIGKSMESFGKDMTTKVTLPIVAAGTGMFAAFTKQEDALARMQGALRANGGQANVTAEEIQNLASSLQATTTFGDEATISAAGLLLTFHNVRNEFGEGNDVFNRTLVAAQNLSAALGTDLESSTMQLAKAIENPVRGMAALSRSGTTFTEEQREMIKAMEESGDTLGAQKAILEVVESQYGGMAETMATTSSGQIKQAFNSLGDSMEQFGAIMAPAVGKVVDKIGEFAKFLQNLSPAQKEWAVRIAAVAAAIGPLALILGKVIGVIGTMINVVKLLGVALQFLTMNPVGLIIMGIAALVAGIIYAYNNFEWFRNGVQAVWEAIQTAVQFAWENVIKPIWDLIYWYIENILIRYIQILWTVYSTVFEAIAGVVLWAWDNVIKPAWDAIYWYIENILIRYIQILWNVYSRVWNGIVAAVQGAWGVLSTVFGYIRDGIGGLTDWISDKASKIIGFFSGIGDGIIEGFKRAFNWVADKWNSTLGSISFSIPFTDISFSVPKLPTFNKGGMVPGIPGDPQLAIVHAGEMILRQTEIDEYRSKRRGSGQGAGDVNVYVNKTDANPYDIGREMLWALKVAG